MQKSIRSLSVMLTQCVLVALSVATAASAQNPPKPQPAAKPLSAMSEGDLFKKGDADFKAGRLLDAREAISLGLTKRKKPEKTYTPLLDKINNQLADQEAAKGDAACKQMDLVTCQKQIAAAKEFAMTPNVTNLSNSYNRTIADLQGQLQAGLKLSASGEYDRALVQLRTLTKYSTYLPSVNADIERTTKSYVQKLLGDGMKSIDERRWEDGSLQLQRVLELDKDNATAKSGLNTIQRARDGYNQHANAKMQLTAKNYAKALESIDAAIAKYPEAPEFEPFKNTIIRDYVASIVAPLDELLSSPNDLVKTRDAYLRLDQVRQLDPENPSIAKYLGPVSENFGANALLKANELENIVDYSKIATAYAMKLSAKQRLPEGTVKTDDLKSIAAAFNRKRVSQLLLSVENLSTGTAAPFVQTIQSRAKNTLDVLGLPDLRIRTLEEFQRTPNEDAQFQELRPDGKSRNVQLTIAVSRYEAERQIGEPTPVRSKYINGTESIPNPEYEKKQDELDMIRASLDKPGRSKDKPTPEGYTETTYNQKERELQRIPPTIQRDKIVDYQYTRTEYMQRSVIELNLTLRDYISRQVLKSHPIRYSPPERQAIETEGVKETDVNGLQNQRLRLPSTDEDLRLTERTTLDNLDKKLQEILPTYTNRFFNEGEKAMRANDVERAVEAYLCHWAFFRGKLPATQLDRVTDVVKRQTGLDLKKEGPVFLDLLDLQ
jgi:tetratricopeptide (TPR) repeat protein